MSIYFDYEVGDTGFRFRRAVEGDRHEIELLLTGSHTEPLFGHKNIGGLIEISVLSLCMVNEENRVVGFLALSDHPNVSSVDPAEWEYWIRNLYQRYLMSRNTLFVHFMCCTDSVTGIFLEEALISVFFNDCYLLHIVFVVPIFCHEAFLLRHGVFGKRNCYKHLPRREEEDRIGNYLVIAARQDFCPKLKMRQAVEEDNDDVVEILDRTNPRMKELYGMYYISELIGRHPESKRQILVGDIQGRAVSVMCLNTEINYRHLQQIYELKPLNYLSASSPLEKEQHKRANELLTVFGDPILKGKWHPCQNINKEAPSFHRLGVSGEFAPIRVNSRTKQSDLPKKLSKVNFQRKTKPVHIVRSLDHIIVKENNSDDFSEKVFNSPSASRGTLYSVVNMLEDDPFEYEIVNIDQRWLKDSSEMRPLNTMYSGASMKKPYIMKLKNNLKKHLEYDENVPVSPEPTMTSEIYVDTDNMMMDNTFEDYSVMTVTTAGASPCSSTGGDVTESAAAPVEDFDPNLLRELGDVDQDPVEFGDNLQSDVAARFQKILLEGLKKETKEELIKKYPFPKNVSLAKSPALNPEISTMLVDNCRQRDKRLLAKQDQLGKVLSALGKALTGLLKKTPDIPDIIRTLKDAGMLLSDSHYAETDTRRSVIMPLIDKSLIDSFKSRKRDTFLFGEKLGDLVKDSRGLKKTGQLMQPSASGSNLNGKGPSSRGPRQQRGGQTYRYYRGGGPRSAMTTQPYPYQYSNRWRAPTAPPPPARRRTAAPYQPAPARRPPPPAQNSNSATSRQT